MRRSTAILGLFLAISGCATSPGAYIAVYQGEPDQGYRVLGPVEGVYNPIDWNAESKLKSKAWSIYGNEADAIIRVQTATEPGPRFPVTRATGVVVDLEGDEQPD